MVDDTNNIWYCHLCTYGNNHEDDTCLMCSTPRVKATVVKKVTATAKKSTSKKITVVKKSTSKKFKVKKATVVKKKVKSTAKVGEKSTVTAKKKSTAKKPSAANKSTSKKGKAKKDKTSKPTDKKVKEKDGENNTYTTVKVGLDNHCTSEGMKEDLSTYAKFVSQSADVAGFAMNALFLLASSTTDPDIKEDIDRLLEQYPPNKEKFAYACMNKENSPFKDLISEVYESCPFPPTLNNLAGKGPLLDFFSKTMKTNIMQHLKNWSKYQRIAISTQIMQTFGIDRKKKRERNKLKRMVKILLQKINGTQPLDSMEECESDKAIAIVNEHRDALGIGSHSVQAKVWHKYEKKRKATRAKEGKGRTAKTSLPKADGMCDEFTEKHPVKTVNYFIFCLGIQEQQENSRRFNFLPTWKHQIGHAQIGNKVFYHLLKRNGDQADQLLLEGWTAASFNRHPDLRDLWIKYFPKIRLYERSNNNLDMKFHNLLDTDGVALSLVFRMTYHNPSTCNNPRIKAIPLRDVPQTITEECTTVLTFGKYRNETFRYVLENDREYAGWCARTALNGDCPDQMVEFMNYVMTDVGNESTAVAPNQDSTNGPTHDRFDVNGVNPFDFVQLYPWWEQDESVAERIKNADNISFVTSRHNKITLSSLCGKYL